MKYYAFIKDGKIIDTNYLFLKYQLKHKTMIICDASEASFIVSSDGTIYEANWLKPAPQEIRGIYKSITLDSSESLYVRMMEAEEYEKADASIQNWAAPIENKQDLTQQETPNTIKNIQRPIDRLESLEKEQQILKQAIDALILQNIKNEKGS